MAKAKKASKTKSASKAKKVTAKVVAKAKSKIKSKPNSKATAKTKAVAKTKAKASVKAEKGKSKSTAKVSAKAKVTTKPKAQKPVKVSAKPQAVKTQSSEARAKSSNKPMQDFVTPLDDRILVQVAEAERMTAGGLYIPDTVTDVSGQVRGQVVAVGRGRMDRKGKIHPMDVKLGDSVVLNEHSGSKIRIQEKDFVFVRESDVLGVQTK